MSLPINPFMYVDATFTADEVRPLFNLIWFDQVEIKILTLQNKNLHFKAHSAAPNFWCLVDKGNKVAVVVCV